MKDIKVTRAEVLKRKKEKEINKLLPTKKVSNSFLDSTIKSANTSALKIIFYFASLLKKTDLIEREYGLNTVTLNKNDLLAYTELTDRVIKSNLQQMTKTSIYFYNEVDDSEEFISLLPRVKIVNNRTIEFDIYTRVANLIIDVDTNYSYLNTKSFMKLNLKHSIRMLGLLNKISNYNVERKTESEHHTKITEIPKRKVMDLFELNDFFDTKYKTWGEMERKILKPIKEELDNKSQITFTYLADFETKGKGRPAFKNVILDLKMQKQIQGMLSLF